MTTIYSRSYSEKAQTLIISSMNSKVDNESYVRFGAFCTAENQMELGDMIISILTKIENLRDSATHFIASYEFLSKGFPVDYIRIKELIINFDDLKIDQLLLCVTADTADLFPFLMAVDEETLINITNNFPIESTVEQIKKVYYSRFFQDLESIEKECVVNG
ncbi:hypothetical protein ACOJIU_12715 [Carnobacterium maltaromaticum]|uniref:hypothetical protein n=1 Tax=Carnobacterium maltaromaticum TaxID=2751 RepID=UPI003B97E6C4